MPVIYSKTKRDFISDVSSGILMNEFLVRETGGSMFGENQMRAIRNSSKYMQTVLEDSNIPDDVGVAIEYKIPASSQRIDFIITGKNTDWNPVVILIELKQWDKAEITDMDAIVKTYVGNGYREVPHPSYQVWSYATFIEDFNESIENNNITLKPCAYLHNYVKDDVIENERYKFYTDKAPVFYGTDEQKLKNFIKNFVKYGDNKETLYLIENGRIRPSKVLADHLVSMLKRNKREFTLIDEQKTVYEKALELARKSAASNKNVYIVEGGPGSGKSVVAINLLAELTSKGKNVRYVTKNSALRKVFEAKLSGVFRPTRIRNFFSSSGGFYNTEKDEFDVLIVDESHRLNLKSGIFKKGENQIKEIINAAKFSIFFIDENQRIETRDIGSKELIKEIAQKIGANIYEDILPSQFRCNGDDGYLAWLDSVLQIKETANETLEGINYDFKVIESPEILHNLIIEKNKTNNKSRVVAGYCWDWISRNNSSFYDIVIKEYKAKWNLNEHGQAWIIHPDSVNEVGCIHTCQGLDLEYVGVIIGPDFVVRNGKIVTDGTKRARTDRSLWGITQKIRNKEPEALATADTII
jgi:DUF2075 family protein